ncbi:hypothetical protein GH714_006369 [Hevea brasiliensis]|uniref:Uncharacterized protein n=1 Tax=Hevea brasiliensis TaxID=3981 RepID=A0A6A6MDL9_HEVBR|nr:hypothetical protein GH714_006369 [Hevea brasiliensis]
MPVHQSLYLGAEAPINEDLAGIGFLTENAASSVLLWVLENISDTVLAVYTVNGSHALDLLRAKASDPQWLIMQRKTEVEIIKGWMAKY